jgi:hypothetical protein
MTPLYSKENLLQFFGNAGLEIPSLLRTLSQHVEQLKDNASILGGLMDEQTHLQERVKILELEVLIRILKKINE